MNLEKGMISSSQLMFLIAGYVIGGVVTLPYASQITQHDTWLVILAGFGSSLPFVLIYIALAQKFPGRNLFEIHDIVYGPYLGKLISVACLFFIFTVLIANLRFISDFTLVYLMPETPILAVLILFMFVCAWSVRNGIEVIARMGLLFVVSSSFIVALTIIFLLKDMELTNFLPVFDVPLKEFLQSTHIIASIPFGEIFILLMFVPSLNKKKQLKRSILLGFSLGGFYLLITMIQNIAVLGSLVSIVSAPSYEAVRLIDIGNILTRLEVLFSIVLIVMVFLKSSLLYYVTVLGTAQLLNLRSYLPLVIPLGILGISFSILSWDSSMEIAYLGSNIWPFYALPFEFLMPALTLLLAKLRKCPNNRKGGS